MNGRSEESTRQHMSAMRIAEKDLQASMSHVEHQSLKPPPAALTPPKRHSRTSEVSQIQSDRSRQASRQSPITRDPEKALSGYQSMQSYEIPSHHARNTYTDDDSSFCEDDDPKNHALWILFYLSALAPLLAFPIAIYTILITIILLLYAPICLCTKQYSLSPRFYHFLHPASEFQLGLIFSSFDPDPDTFHSKGSIAVLIFANAFAPVCAIFVAGAAWLGGFFWCFTRMMGNPDGKEVRDDGRDFVLAVRGWWERWLIQGLG